MNSRRRISHASKPLYGQPIAVGATCLALSQCLPIIFCSARGRNLPIATGVILTARRRFRGIADVAGPGSLHGPRSPDSSWQERGTGERGHGKGRHARFCQIVQIEKNNQKT
jgi:hypothetical protein